MQGYTACRRHDKINLFVLPLLAFSAVAGLLGLVEPLLVTQLFMGYIIIDLVWLCVEPKAVPSMPEVVIGHHLITILLILFPLLHPEFAVFTCWDGVVEMNTTFVIARRYFNRSGHGGKFFNWCHWGTFLPLRFLLYPWLIAVFWRALSGYALWKKVWVCGAQLALCGFNFLFLHAILTKHKFDESLAATLSQGDLKTFGK